MHRRAFLKTSAAGLAYAAVPILPHRRRARYRTVLIGTGWWGMNILREAMAAGQSEVVGLCDVDRRHLDDAYAEVERLSGDRPKRYTDYRELIAETRPEIAIVATPDHWHALCAIAAIEAGAHVYIEKPISHTIDEGKAIVRAARAHERTVQVGTHRRVSPHNISGMQFLKSGKVGDIGMVRMFVHYGGGPGEVTPDEEPPPELDWDMWLGPAPYRPFNPRIHPRGFRQFLDYANGQLGDWGIHWLDQLLWWSEEPWPRHVYSTGGRFIREDNTTAPDTQIVTYAFESFSAVWEHRLYAANNAEHHNIGCYFYGTEGTFHMGWQDGWTFYPTRKSQPIIHENPQLHKPDDQNIRELWADFLDAIETGRRPVCDIEIGYRATNMSLLGMLSWKLGRSVEWDGERGVIVGDEEANRLLRRPYRAPWVYPE
ncbi:MAG: gfo/Idh/MocA family oxidoreductase [Bacteroidetes bacterium]|nr:MAG: gfo/Idh/MocA family oxidoreductase [Bacteroidota bacterium]